MKCLLHTHTRHCAAYFTYADEHSLGKGSHRFHALCAKVNRRGKRKLPVILTGTKVQPPTTKTTKKLENPRSAAAAAAAARLVEARSRRKRSNGTGGSYRRSFTRMHNYPVSWRTSSTGVSIAALLCFFSPPFSPSSPLRRASAFLWLMKAHLSLEWRASLVSFAQDKCSSEKKGRMRWFAETITWKKRNDDLSEKRLFRSLCGVHVSIFECGSRCANLKKAIFFLFTIFKKFNPPNSLSSIYSINIAIRNIQNVQQVKLYKNKYLHSKN